MPSPPAGKARLEARIGGGRNSFVGGAAVAGQRSVRAIGRAQAWHDEWEGDYRAFLAAQGEAEPAIDAEIAAAGSESGLG